MKVHKILTGEYMGLGRQFVLDATWTGTDVYSWGHQTVYHANQISNARVVARQVVFDPVGKGLNHS